MQRKNHILMKRNGIAMIMAIVVLVVLATIMGMSLAMTAQTSKRTTDIYLYEQAVLLSHSAAEYAMLEIAKVAPCTLGSLPMIEYEGLFDINVTMSYVAMNSGVVGSCNSNATPAGLLVGTTSHQASDGTVIMEISVGTKPDITDEPIRYFRRVINKM